MAVSASRKAKVELVAESKGMDAGLKDAARKLRLFEREQIKAAKTVAREQARADKEAARERQRSMGAIGGGMKAVGFGVAAAAGFDVAAGFGGMVKDVFDLDKQMTRLRITGEQSAAQIAAFKAEVMRSSDATGVSANELAGGAIALVNFTGNADAARQSLELMGKTMKATDASAADVAGIFAMFDKNIHLPADQWGKAMDVLVKQGHIGGIEMKDLAGSFARAGAAGAMLFEGGASVEGLSRVSAMAQVLNNMTHDAATTTTYLNDMFQDFKKPTTVKRMREHGIEPFDLKTGMLKQPLQILDEIAKKKLSIEQMGGIFRDIRGEGTIEFLEHNLALVHQIDDASQDSNQTQIDFALEQESSSGKMEAAWNRLKNAISGAMTTERVAAFADAMKDLADKIEPVAKVLGVVADILGGIKHAGQNISDEFYGSEDRGDGTVPFPTSGKKYDEDLVGDHNYAALNIREAQGSQARLQRALAFKYNKVEGAAGTGQQLAGNEYLKTQKFSDPIDIMRETNRLLGKLIDEANKAVIVKVDPNDVHGGTANAYSRTTTPRGAR